MLEFTNKFVMGTILLLHLTLSPKPGTTWQQDEDNLEDFLEIQEQNRPDRASHSLSAISLSQTEAHEALIN